MQVQGQGQAEAQDGLVEAVPWAQGAEGAESMVGVQAKVLVAMA